MGHKFRNKLGYDLEIGHAYLVRMVTREPIKESANIVMFYLGEAEGFPMFTPILDDNPTDNEATLDYELFNQAHMKGNVTVIGRFQLVDCNPDEIKKGKNENYVAPALDGGGPTKH